MQKQQDHLNFADDTVLDKTTIKKINCTSSRPIKINDRHLEEISSFVYLGSTVSVNGGTDENIKERINKARVVFNLLKTKLRIFNSNVKSVLLYGSETWRNTKSSNNKLQKFGDVCLRRTLKISWTADRLTNEDLWKQASQEVIQIQIRLRKWRWIGHTLRKHPDSVSRQALK